MESAQSLYVWDSAKEADEWLCLIECIEHSNDEDASDKAASGKADSALAKAIEIAEKRFGALQFTTLKNELALTLYKAWQKQRCEVYLLHSDHPLRRLHLIECDVAKMRFLRVAARVTPHYTFWYGTMIKLQACQDVHLICLRYPGITSIHKEAQELCEKTHLRYASSQSAGGILNPSTGR